MNRSATPKARKLLRFLTEAVHANPADALMLSGGIDSSLLAALDPQVPAYTVCLQGHALDLDGAQMVASHLGLDWTPITITANEALAALRTLVELTQSYDPGLLNDIPLFVGMTRAKDSGAGTIRTGDFADTLFAGYEYLWEIDLPEYLRELLPHLTLASERLGKRLGLAMDYPYLNPKLVAFAIGFGRSDNLSISTEDGPGDFHIQVKGGTPTECTWSKITLRRAAAGLLPPAIAWRIKTDLEYGSGMYLLEDALASAVSNNELAGLGRTGLRFWGRPHMGLYLLYREAGLSPAGPNGPNEYACKWCGGGIVRGRRHCLTCGAYPADKTPE